MKDEYEIVYYGAVKDGQLTGIPKKKLQRELQYFEGVSVELIIRKKRKIRSYEQNRLWWLYQTILADHTGIDKNDMHEICKFKFLKTEAVNEKSGEVFEYIKSTTKL